MPLSILIWLPLFAALAGALAGGRWTARAAVAGALGVLGLAVFYVVGLKSGQAGLQHVTNVVWISELGIHYKLGVDGLNLFLIALTGLLFVAAIVVAARREWERP